MVLSSVETSLSYKNPSLLSREAGWILLAFMMLASSLSMSSVLFITIIKNEKIFSRTVV